MRSFRDGLRRDSGLHRFPHSFWYREEQAWGISSFPGEAQGSTAFNKRQAMDERERDTQ